mmetsp:Transcript_17645/g.21386  ORF Transcript_17645/g.21386 Transcript_17645/m.21386 type:complete len:189 (+) Transcript_17645:79-645(+)
MATGKTRRKQQDAMLAALLETSFKVQSGDSAIETDAVTPGGSESQRRLQEIRRKQALQKEASLPLNSTTSMFEALEEAVEEKAIADRLSGTKNFVSFPKQKLQCRLLDETPQTGYRINSELFQFVHKTHKRQVINGSFELKKKEFKAVNDFMKKSRKSNKKHKKSLEKGIGYELRQQQKKKRKRRGRR